ncbi:hypothetical protein J437_LFUL014432 [Ladona fulva]|uniref:Uncharacterized protein n=1 Tax=Ladona fulva TaxID=123851 RepID=A0A8K0KCT2_LADFU|nr:hypothetical protein J437_LFUL014432 [Ladona fulva]
MTLKEKTCFKLSLNVDGVPLFKSSTPILVDLCRLVEYDLDSFVVSIYEGKSKPATPGILLKSVIDEINELVKVGIDIENVAHDVVIHAIICDAPARSFKCTRSHTGYSGCECCVVKGKLRNHKMVFCDVNAELRNDTSFRNYLDKDHHTGETPLLTIECVVMVSQFSLDYMHLVCLGSTEEGKEVILKCSQFGVAEVTVKGTRFSAVNTKDYFCMLDRNIFKISAIHKEAKDERIDRVRVQGSSCAIRIIPSVRSAAETIQVLYSRDEESSFWVQSRKELKAMEDIIIQAAARRWQSMPDNYGQSGKFVYSVYSLGEKYPNASSDMSKVVTHRKLTPSFAMAK